VEDQAGNFIKRLMLLRPHGAVGALINHFSLSHFSRSLQNKVSHSFTGCIFEGLRSILRVEDTKNDHQIRMPRPATRIPSM
jgi:hypothetical protein